MRNQKLAVAQGWDAPVCAEILLNWVRQTPWMPELWTMAQTENFVGSLIARGSVQVLRGSDEIIMGFIDVRDGWVNCLYLTKGARRQGFAKLLLDHAARLHPEGLHLWTFAANEGAIRFYQREGFSEVKRTDGDNDEGLPDIQFHRAGNKAVTI